jgi:hypothetical protein
MIWSGIDRRKALHFRGGADRLVSGECNLTPTYTITSILPSKVGIPYAANLRGSKPKFNPKEKELHI